MRFVTALFYEGVTMSTTAMSQERLDEIEAAHTAEYFRNSFQHQHRGELLAEVKRLRERETTLLVDVKRERVRHHALLMSVMQMCEAIDSDARRLRDVELGLGVITASIRAIHNKPVFAADTPAAANIPAGSFTPPLPAGSFRFDLSSASPTAELRADLQKVLASDDDLRRMRANES
jgi:hypothetical protein